MADTTATSVENQETLQATQALAGLSSFFHVVPSQDGNYTPDWGEALSKAISVSMEEAQRQADSENQTLPSPMARLTALDVVSRELSELTGQPAEVLSAVIGNADHLINHLNEVSDNGTVPIAVPPVPEAGKTALFETAMMSIQTLGNLLEVPAPKDGDLPQDYAKSVQEAYDQAIAKEAAIIGGAAGGRIDAERVAREKLIDDLANKVEATELSQVRAQGGPMLSQLTPDRNSLIEKLLYDLERNAEFVYEVVGSPTSEKNDIDPAARKEEPQQSGVQVSAQQQQDASLEVALLITAVGLDVPTNSEAWDKAPQAVENNIASRVEAIRGAEDGAELSDDGVRAALVKQISDEYSQKVDGKPAEDDRIAKVSSLLEQRAGNYTILGLPTPTVPEAAAVVAGNQAPEGGQTTVEKTVINGRSPEESQILMDKIRGVEEVGLAQIVPRLNTLTHQLGKVSVDLSPDEDIALPQNMSDGIWDQSSVDSYQATMQHLIYLVELNDLPDEKQLLAVTTGMGGPEKSGHDIDAFLKDDTNVQKLQGLLQGSLQSAIEQNNEEQKTATGDDLARLQQEKAALLNTSIKLPAILQDMRVLNEIPAVLGDIQDLNAQGLLDKPFEVSTVSVAVSNTNTQASPENQSGAGVSELSEQELADHERNLKAQTEGSDLNKDIELVKSILQGAAAALPEQMGNLAGGKAGGLNIAGFDLGGLGGLANGIMSDYTITEAEVKNGEFGEKENNILAVALMAVKTMNGEEGANGVYDESAKATLHKMVLTHPAFQAIRDEKQLPTVPADHYKEYEAALQAKSKAMSDNPEASYNKTIDTFEEKYATSLAGVGRITDALDRLKEKDLIDNQKAAQKTQESVMGNMFMRALDSVGMGGFIRDFFNSEFGQMVGSFLGMIGIDVDFILGNTEKPETGAALEQKSITRAEGAFDQALQKAQEANPDASFQDQMAVVLKDYESNNSGISGALKDATLSVTVGRENVAFMNAAVKDALEKAAGTDSPEAAKAAFRSSLRESAEAYTSKQEVELSGKPYTASSATVSGSDVASGFESVARSVGEENPELLKQLRADANARNQAASLPPADAIKLAQDNTYATVTVKADNGEYPQDPTRFANAEGVNRVQPIAQFLIENGENLGLDADNLATLTKDDGSAVDVMTPEFNALVQELWVEANIHEQLEAGKPVTEDFIKGIPEFDPYDEGEPTGHMKVVENYAKAQDGVDGDKFDAMFHANIQSLDTDYGSAADGQVQADSVWEQSFKIGEILVDIMQYQPRQAADVDINDGIEKAYLAAQDPNSDCEIPVFVPDEKTGDVYVLIRDKNPEEGQPEIQKLKMDDYLNTGRIDPAIVQELVDNYNWQGEVDHARDARLGEDAKLGEYTMAEKTAEIIKYMEDCLGIHAIDTSCVVNSGECKAVFNERADQDISAIYVTEGVRYTEHANDVHDTALPDTFSEMRYLSIEDANEITLALEGKYGQLPTQFEEGRSNYTNNVDRPTLYQEGDEYKRLEDMFRAEFGKGDGYMFMDLETMGIEHSDVDTVVVYKRGNDVDFRFLNNEEDRVVSSAEQRANGPNAVTTTNDFTNGDRTLDTLLAFHRYNRSQGPDIQGPAEGYRGAIAAIVPSGDQIHHVRASSALFDIKDQQTYRKAHAAMWDERSSYLVTRQERLTRVLPGNEPEQKVGTSKVFGDEVGRGPEASNDDRIQENTTGATGADMGDNPEDPALEEDVGMKMGVVARQR
ncbi:MAG: hypothetical protein ACRBDL_10475 [Alphaproteobacteria bacterium]